jgi:TonB-linked SusC/RagA family outer membrane protein
MKRKILLLFFCLFCINSIRAQNVKVSGKVTEAGLNEGLIGVSVSVKGATTTTQTNVNGEYSIDAPGDGTLVFTYVGFVTKEVGINNQTSINVEMSTSTQSLEQVVVIGYGTQRKRDLTGSITSVKGEDIAKSPNINPLSSLQGKVAGLTIVNNGTPGAAPTVRIRGVNSTNSAGPTYVVDGVIQTNVDYLNPADIESIEVLKDPSSTAIFGVQGGNGVIVITTKRAAKGETRISFESSVGIQTVPNKIDVVDANGFKKLYSAQLANLNAAPFDYTNYTANTNWQDLILRDASMTNNNLSVSNTGEKSSTLLNIGYNNHNGVVRNSGFQKYTARINHEIRFNDNIKVGGDVNAFHYKANPSVVNLNNALWAAPIVGVQFDENTYYSMPTFQRAQVGNPIATLNRMDRTSINRGYRAVGNIFGEVKFLKDFTWRSSFYTDISFINTRGYTPLANRFMNLGEGNIPTNITVDNNVRTSVNQRIQEYRKFQQDHTLTYNKTINEDHRITALAGFSTIYTGDSNVSGNRRDTTLNIPNDPDFWYLNIANLSNPGSYGGGGAESAQMSYFGRINYAFQNKYLVNASIRRDGISKFAPSNRWGTFGSVGLGWVVSDEDFFKDIKGLDFLKLRGSWGTLGNAQGFGENLYLPGLANSSVGVFGDNVYTSVAPDYIADPNLHWEVIRGLDFGLELRAFDSRLSGEFVYYNRKTTDILTRITPIAIGGRSLLTNLGDITNKGVEISLGWSDKIGDSDFSYSVTPNFSYNKNMVESIGDRFDFQLTGNGGVNRTTTGESIGYFYGYRQIGIYQSTADLERTPAWANSLPGDISYADLNGDGAITEADREKLGSPFPDYNYGLNISLGYKKFDFLLEGQGVAGNYVYTERRKTNTFATLNYESNRLNAWTGPGTSNIEPILDNTRANNNLMSTYFLEPGDYFRLRTVQVGYTFGDQTLNKIGIKSLRLYLSGQNLKTWSKTTGYTPEAPLNDVLGAGADNGVYPLPAIYTFGLRLTL